MSPRKLTLLSVVALVLLFLCAGLVFAQRAPREKPSKVGLGLTPEQKEKIRSIALGGRMEQIQRQADLKIAYLGLREQMMQDKLDKVQINRKLEQIGTLRTRLQVARVETIIKLRDILTKEQIQSLRERRMHRMLNRRVIEKRIRLNEGKVQRFQRQGMGMGPGYEEMMLPPMQEEEIELSIAPQEPVEPEIPLLEEELAPLFDEFEPEPPMEELQPFQEEELLPEE